MKTSIVYIGLGSNIEQPDLQIKNAITALDELPGVTVIRDSGYYKSKPMGPKDQPDYVNAVVEIETALEVAKLLKHCQQIEKQQGRIKSRRWGERTIDLDILLYADKQIQTDVLTVPHPGICLRDFVYMPLLKLNPDIKVPGTGLLKSIVEKLATEKYKTDHNCQFAGKIGR
ncbi:MAG: 2-amino-4-hydroxy-6-hydroxymethyldihydropteridine diphosphokinase [Gammaproteobacteria bacterium]|nr:MAG: 2-amino-4-hydroxy-6-hydroxymethyldihydropteridine diphosphokinase [Gammaproteobacteria bacterium]